MATLTSVFNTELFNCQITVRLKEGCSISDSVQPMSHTRKGHAFLRIVTGTAEKVNSPLCVSWCIFTTMHFFWFK